MGTISKESKKVCIVVRTYPMPAHKGVEVSCTAGITDSGKWIRLFPVPYRFLDHDKRFRKYQWIEVAVQKGSDPRPESYRIFEDTIKITSAPLSTQHNWTARRKLVSPVQAHCLCCLERDRKSKGIPTLGLFKPRIIEKLLIEKDQSPWTPEQLQLLQQGHLFNPGPKTRLEKVPYQFRYKFQCDEDSCNGHTLICTDWEIGESWRKWSREYRNKWEEKFRNRYEKEMIEKSDTHFFVGTHRVHPQTWMIVGLFYPPRDVQRVTTLPLFY